MYNSFGECSGGTLFQDVTNWVKNVRDVKTAKVLYIEPQLYQGSIVINNPLYLVHIDFMKLDSSKRMF